MGTGSFTDQNDGEVADAVDVQQLIDAGKGDLVPRNSLGVATANAGDLGTSTYPFKKAEITTGYFVPGDLKFFHDFDGLLTPGQGWMKCNGDIVNETNYDAIHGAGSWAAYIGSSPLNGKNLPDCNDKYLVGSDTTTQDGASPITTVGNASHSITTSNHTHTTPNHNHGWFVPNVTAGKSYNSSGALTNLVPGSVSSGPLYTGATLAIGLSGSPTSEIFTSNDNGGNTGSNGGETIDAQPESHLAQVWIRII